MSLGGGLRATSKTSTAASAPGPAVRAAVSPGCRRSSAKEIQAACLRSGFVPASLLFKRSGRARFASTSGPGGYCISGTVSHGAQSGHVCNAGDVYRGRTINCRISTGGALRFMGERSIRARARVSILSRDTTRHDAPGQTATVV